MSHKLLGKILFAIGLLTTFGFDQEAVQFGQNKVQYHSFHWQYYQTPHFDIYYPQGGEHIAQFAARHVEEMYGKVSAMTGHPLRERIPIILHNSHAEFEQTNVIPIPLDEAIGGFTEEFKNRIVLPFEGNYPEFYHVLQHEMTHAVMNDLLYGDDAGSPVTSQIGERLPLWFSEGLAEYTSLGWDLGSEFFMVDATTFGYVASPAEDFGGFLAYKGGQLFLHFVDNVYGKGTVTKLIRAMTTDSGAHDRDLEKAFQKVTRTSLEEAGEIWLRELRYLYWPELGQRQYGKSVARKLTRHGEDRSFYNLQPSLSPNGEEIAFFSDRESWEAIYILNVKTEKVVRTVIQSGKKEAHESFHSFKSGIAWSPDGKALAIVSKQEGRDVIHILDSKKGRVRQVLKPDVEAILSPNWSRDGRYIAFSGQSEGFTDIYVYDLQTDSLRRLTSDIAHDDKPVFSPSGKWIAFESDRPKPILDPNPKDPLAWFDSLRNYKDIYRISVSDGSLTRMVGGEWDEKMPVYGPSDSLLYFVSNRSGLDNIYLWQDSAGGEKIRPVTNLLTACFTPSLSYDGKKLAFSLFEAGGWDVYLMKDPLQKLQPMDLPKTRFIRRHEDSAVGFFRPPNWANLSSYKPDTTKPDTTKKKDSTAVGRGGLPSALTPDTVKTDTTKIAKKEKKKKTPFLTDTTAYKDSLGRFLSHPYRSKWSLDAINAAFGVDNYYGASGLSYLTLSDLMGDQSISLALAINGSLDNINGFVEYDYLPYKPDFDLMGFRQSQQTSALVFSNNPSDSSIFERDFTDLLYGVGAGVKYPLSTFTRFELALVARFATSKWQQYDSLGNVDTASRTVTNSVLPTLSWVQDNSQWGIVGPVSGHRALVVAQYLPPMYQNKFSYYKMETDLRAYWEFFKRYTFAARVSGGFSEAMNGYTNPHKFVVGGESYTFNPHVNFDNLPKSLAEYYFSDLEFPLRGYDFYEFTGTRKFLTNFEFRYPFISEFTVEWPLPFSIRNVMGNIFLDYGGAWSEGDPLRQMGIGAGYGLRLNLGIFVLKYTWAQSFRGSHGNSAGTNRNLGSREYWSLGTEF